MTKIRFNRLLSVVLALAMLATMMSFVFTANAADVSASVYEDLTYTTWPALGIDSNSTTANSSATARYSDSKVGGWGTADGSVIKVYGSKTFDLSNGFSFNWKMGLGPYAATRDFNCMINVGDLQFLLMNGSTLKLRVRNGSSTSVIFVSDTALANKGVQAFSISVTADGKLSVAVNDDEIAQTNIDVSALDFSNVSFNLVSWFGYSGGSGAGQTDGCIFEDPTLTVKKVPTTEAKKPVNVNTWTDLGLANAETFRPTMVTVTDNAITGSNGTWDGAAYGITASEEFDLSGGFTFTWSMGDNGWGSTDTGNSTKNAYNAISIGGITVASQRSGLGDRLGKVYVVKNEAKAADNSNKVIAALWWKDNTQLAVFGSVLHLETDLANANNVKDYSLTVTADGKLSLSVAGTTICSNIDVSGVDFSAATFSIKSGTSFSGGSKYTNPNLTYNAVVPARTNFVVTKDGQGFVKCDGKNWIDRDVAAGTLVTLTAEAAYGYTFQGWVNGVNNTVVSTDPTLTVHANTTNNYTAVFVKNSGKYTVTVLNRFGKVVATASSFAAGDKYTLPAAVDVTGYTFQGWQVKDSEDTTAYAAGTKYTVTGNVIFVPVYDVVATPTTYNIHVTGGSADKTTANYNELVTVTADDVDNFGYWKKNGFVVSYSSTYSFYAGLANGTDINLVAVEATASAAPVTSIVNVYGSTAKVTFLMERSVPDGYSLVESGFILAKAAFGTDDYMSAVNGTTVIKVAASNTSANGQYMLNVKTTTGNAIYAVSYVTYVDASGKLHTVYSSAASANAQ